MLMIVIRNCECDRSFEVILTEVPFEPHVVNPLSVDTRPSGKKRLIRDLRHVNKFLLNEHIKFDDWRTFQHFVRPGGFLFKFDLRKGYHHVSMAPEHQTYLGFSWKINGRKKYFVFIVLPFGLSTAPMLFTKILDLWYQHGISRVQKEQFILMTRLGSIPMTILKNKHLL